MATYQCANSPFQVGGEKAVYRGICVETRIEVVLKFLKGPYTHADKQRFEIEIRRLQKANTTAGTSVATLIDHNLDWDPPFYVEEYFPDGTLAEKMQGIFRQGYVFRDGAAVGYCRQILECLQGIHNGNQIHRDVKPSNIMVSGKTLVLNDMGIGRTLNRPTILQTRAFCGTKGYAAPEQELGLGVDHRCDLYAVGVILHEMLTGTRGAYNHITYDANLSIVSILNYLLAFNRNERYATAKDAAWCLSILGIATR